jgi:hypothetical protein
MKKFALAVLLFAIIPQIALALVSSAPTVVTGTDGSSINGDGAGNMKVTIQNSSVAVTAASLPLPSGAATETTLSAMSAKLPASVGQKAMSASMPVVIASDQGAIPVSFSAGTIMTQSTTFTTAVAGATLDAHLAPVKYFSLQVTATGAVTSWTVNLECSLDNTTFTTVLTHTNTSPGTGQIVSLGTSAFPCLYFRAKASALSLGSGTNVVAVILGM